VDDRLARRFWGSSDPIGRRMYRPTDPKDLLAVNEKTEWFTVVGVVGEVKLDGLITPQTPVGAYYFPMEQSPSRLMTFAIRTATDPQALLKRVRAEVSSIDPELPLFSVMTMEERTAASLVNRRWPVMLASGFAVVALLLAAIGIYGVLAYLVAQRTKEIGIRMALGGTPRAIFDMVAREGLGLVAVGLAAGAGGMFLVRKAIEAQLYNVGLGDPAVIVLAMLLLAAVALLACAIPARRATRIDPVLALNQE
jgi:hypothetical protein